MSDTLKIEAGRYYRARNGAKCRAVGRYQHKYQESPWIIESVSPSGGVPYCCGDDGVCKTWPEYSLVAEWREPRTFKVHIVESECGELTAVWAVCNAMPCGGKIIASGTLIEGEIE